MQDIKFEAAVEKLEKIVDALERGDISLDDSLKKYQEGIGLAAACRKKLEGARKKVEILVEGRDGATVSEPFDPDGTLPKRKKKKKEKDGDAGLF